MRRRRRQRVARIMLSFLALCTAAVLVVIVVMIKDISKPPVPTQPAALAVSSPLSSSGGPGGTPSPRTKASASPAVIGAGHEVTDGSSGLSYQLLASPWRRGCPLELNTPMFSWSTGENAVAGRATVDGAATEWYGSACSGLLGQQFAYSGPADLEPTAMGLVGALDPAYYSGLRHYRSLEGSSALTISGHQAWEVRFLMTYPDAAGQGLTWSSEAGAVVIADRGPGRVPAVFYVSVPSNLGTSDVGTLTGSLRLS
jgi:hypothetical protein